MAASSEVTGEVLAETYQPVDEMLRLHDEDPYGYVSQAAATLPRLSLSNDRRQGYMAVADYASAVHNPRLMRACFGELDLAAQWEIFAHEERDGHWAIDTDTLKQLGISLAELEAEPAAERDWVAIADIYVSQAEIILQTGGDGLDIQLDRIEAALQREYAANSRKQYSNLDRTKINRRLVHSLLLADMPEIAERFSGRLHPYYYEEYTESLPLYARYRERKPLTPVQEHALPVFRRLAPEEYVSSNLGHQFQARYGAKPDDVKALLQVGQFEKAQELYEGMLGYSFEFSGDRVSMALDMALYVPRGDYSQTEIGTVSAMEGVRGLSQVIEAEPQVVDIMESASRTKELEAAVQGMCERVPMMPFSSQRIGLALELARLQQKLLPQSGITQQQCESLLFNTWSVVAHTHANRYGDHAPGTRELWKRFKEVGLDLKRLQQLDRTFADYIHPKFRPKAS